MTCLYESCERTAPSRDPRVCWLHYVGVVLLGQCSRLRCERPIKYKGRALCGACFMRLRRGGEIRDLDASATARVDQTFDTSWQENAACVGMDPDLFYPGPGERDKVKAARDVCARCSVARECAEFAFELRDPFGIFGGLTPVERLMPRGELVGA